MNSDWKLFEMALGSRGRSFQAVEHAADRTAVIHAAGFTDALTVATLETEWSRRVGVAAAPTKGSGGTAAAAPTHTVYLTQILAAAVTSQEHLCLAKPGRMHVDDLQVEPS